MATSRGRNRLYFVMTRRLPYSDHFNTILISRSILIAIIISSFCSNYHYLNAELTPPTSSSTLLKVPNFCNDCSKNGCLNEGKCRNDDGRCDCQRGFWGNRCQYKNHEMYKFGQCPSEEVLGNHVFDWPQLQPDGCHVDADCPGLWKCCPSFVASEGHRDRHAPIGTRSCTQPWLEAPLVEQLPLCLQHLWNVTDAGRTFSGCDILVCDESSGGRAFDRWQCNYCDATSTTCFCFISFDNEGKYWGELPGSRQKLSAVGEPTTDRPGVIHRMPKHDCSLQDRCPQMFPHSIYCAHGIQRDPSGCPTGDCLSIPEDKCFTPCSAGFLCEHRPEPEQVNHWHCVDTFRQFRVAVPISSRLAYAIQNELENVSAKAAELVAFHAIVDESIFSLLTNSSNLPCSDPVSTGKQSALRATTAATAYLLPLQDNQAVSVIEIVGQVAFSANFSGVLVRRYLKEWLNETYGSRLVVATKDARTRNIMTMSIAGIALISAVGIVVFLAIAVGVPLIVYRRRLFATNKFSFSPSSNSNQQSDVVVSGSSGAAVFSAFTNPNHRYGANVNGSSSSSPSSSSSTDSQAAHQMNYVKAKNRPAPLPPTTVTPLPEISSTSSSEDDGSVSPNNITTPPGGLVGIGQLVPTKGTGDPLNENYEAF